MKSWHINYWSEGRSSPIEKWLDKLTNEQLKSVLKELRLLQMSGNTLRLPHSKSLGSGLFELRDHKFGFRIYYCFQDKQLIILLAVGDKTSQQRDIKTAYDRLSKLEG